MLIFYLCFSSSFDMFTFMMCTLKTREMNEQIFLFFSSLFFCSLRLLADGRRALVVFFRSIQKHTLLDRQCRSMRTRTHIQMRKNVCWSVLIDARAYILFIFIRRPSMNLVAIFSSSKEMNSFAIGSSL